MKVDDRRAGAAGETTQLGSSSRRDVERRCYFLVFDGRGASMVPLPEQGELVIGRTDSADVHLVDAAVSRRHARVAIADGRVSVVDLGSSNGTRVNGEEATTPRELASGDVISICEASLVFHADGRARVRPARAEAAELRARVQQEVERSLRFRRSAALVAVDTGERELEPARRIVLEQVVLTNLRAPELFAWDGAARLVLLLPERGVEGARPLARRLLAAAALYAPGVRAGIVECPGDGCDADSLLAGARAAAASAAPGAIAGALDSIRRLRVGELEVLIADPAMARLFALLERLAPSDLTVLISGETGSGKELAAATLHALGGRAGPLVAVNCAALPDTLVESELFGHEKGAFTGAVAAKQGLLERAHGGTLFLDEVGELSPGAQAKLLRALETRRVARIGAVREQAVEVRVVAATNRALAAEVEAGRFRRDLFFRLSAVHLVLPPLRDRPRELSVLARAFLADACARVGREPMTLSAGALERLARYAWPGNVRELRNTIEYVVATTTSEPSVEPWHLPEQLDEPDPIADAAGVGDGAPRVASADGAADAGVGARDFRNIYDEIEELERARIEAALEATAGVRNRAAELIGMPLRTFTTKLKQYGIDPPIGRSRPR